MLEKISEVGIRWRLLVGGILVLSVVCADTQEFDNDSCLFCHGQKKPTVDAKVFAASVHGSQNCTDCHRGIEDIPHPKQLKKVNCSPCHSDQAEAFSKSIHSELLKKEVPGVPTCKDCHGMHDILKVTDLRSRVNHFAVDETCLKCHSTEGKNYRGSIHGRGVHKEGLLVSATCTDCHGGHSIRPKVDTTATTFRDNVPNTCKKCHLGIYSDYETSTHGMLWKGGRQDVPVCNTCHKSHEIKEPEGTAFQLHIPDECGSCHKEAESTYKDTFHGKATSLGFVVGAKCSDCHTPHKNLPAANPASTVNPSNLAATCGKCHKNVNQNFIEYNPHADSHNKNGAAATYYVRTFMDWLLIAVFAFFGVHTLLWLQRSLVAFFKMELPPEVEGEKYVTRFSGVTVWVHVVIVISFLTLAATGLPLKFHYTGWAKSLGSVLGGVEVARYFHRVFAVVTFGYALFHAGFLMYQVAVKKRRELIYGPYSLVPRWQDFDDLLKNLRWFVYAGPRPSFGRWTYFEKFDYFAVFWGIPVIGLSGLVMWFPGFFTKFLPGEALNIAAIVHGEEALLAVGFIFTVHFFHNHVRPENFPMDPSIFTGKISLSRFKSERAEEYEAAIRENRLESMLVEAPTATEMLRARIFGFCALFVGLTLVAGIILTAVF